MLVSHRPLVARAFHGIPKNIGCRNRMDAIRIVHDACWLAPSTERCSRPARPWRDRPSGLRFLPTAPPTRRELGLGLEVTTSDGTTWRPHRAVSLARARPIDGSGGLLPGAAPRQGRAPNAAVERAAVGGFLVVSWAGRRFVGGAGRLYGPSRCDELVRGHRAHSISLPSVYKSRDSS